MSSWLRDYLYIPLGGNRKGPVRTYINLMVTMLLGGLWHGANWTFVAWGGLHGLYLWVEKFFTDRKGEARSLSADKGYVVEASAGAGSSLAHLPPVLPKIARMPEEPPAAMFNTRWAGWPYALFTFFLVNITWVFFRASTFSGAGNILRSLFGMVHGAAPLLTTLAMIKVTVIITIMLVLHWLLRNTRVLDLAHRLPWWLTGLIWSSMVILLILSQESSSSFIYFQF